MAAVYFDTSVFLAILAGQQPQAREVRALLRELKAEKPVVRIYTSILTAQEVSVSSFSHGGVFADNHTKLSKLARIKGVTREIALTAAKFEAAFIDQSRRSAPKVEEERISDNRRRKFDCFHLATAVVLNCSVLYAFDDKFSSKCSTCGIMLRVETPAPKKPGLFDGMSESPGLEAPATRR